MKIGTVVETHLKLVEGTVAESPNWVHLRIVQKANHCVRVVEERWQSLLQTTKQGGRQLLLNSQAPQGVRGQEPERGEGSYRQTIGAERCVPKGS